MLRDLYDDPRSWPEGRAVGGWPTWRDRLADPRDAVVIGPRGRRAETPPPKEVRQRGSRIPVVEPGARPHAPGSTALPTEAAEPDREPSPPASSLKPADDERAKLREALRDLEQAKERVERDAEQARQLARAELVEKLLPVMDNLDRSVDAAAHSTDGALTAGLELVREQFEQVLQGFGLERFDAEGEPFDPALHEAVGTIPASAPDEDGKVVRQWQAGYRFGDRVLRAAKVQVGRAEPDNEA
ncbi:MAG: nucleotide exchange factor GrpE [Deltaproteobacteria bacterium]|jgi:molecular chaperone GrpE (heat shock protein)|nr:nucleotide exchange factor GrpE [Deltaproteobacteria bacterium]MBW2530200.1 nucleotide exchange factor GrpE [Deltaproteobacteria bacterium]